jgi:hypothetical protein
MLSTHDLQQLPAILDNDEEEKAEEKAEEMTGSSSGLASFIHKQIVKG